MMSKIGLLKYTKEHVVAVGIEASRTLHELSTPYQVFKNYASDSDSGSF